MGPPAAAVLAAQRRSGSDGGGGAAPSMFARMPRPKRVPPQPVLPPPWVLPGAITAVPLPSLLLAGPPAALAKPKWSEVVCAVHLLEEERVSARGLARLVSEAIKRAYQK